MNIIRELLKTFVYRLL